MLHGSYKKIVTRWFVYLACRDVGGQSVYFDPSCLDPGNDRRGGVGCNAGGQGQGCRFG
jgi:hypothetical protein